MASLGSAISSLNREAEDYATLAAVRTAERDYANKCANLLATFVFAKAPAIVRSLGQDVVLDTVLLAMAKRYGVDLNTDDPYPATATLVDQQEAPSEDSDDDE